MVSSGVVNNASVSIGLLSGTGQAGLGLAARLAAAGVPVIVGSRDRERAETVVSELAARWDGRLASITPATNEEAAKADVVVIGSKAQHTLDTVVPYRLALTGKLVISMAAQLRKADRGMQADMAGGVCVAEMVQRALPDSTVVAAFHHLPAASMIDPAAKIHADVLVCGDDRDAVNQMGELFGAVTTGAFYDAGVLANAIALEAMTAALVAVNLLAKARMSIQLVDTRP